MEKKTIAYDLGSYKYSDAFSDIDSELGYKDLAFNEFLEEGESLVNTKQSVLDAQLFALYEKDEEEGQIYEQQDHYIGSVINSTLGESFSLAATSYLYSQFEYLLFEIAKKTGILFNSPISVTEFKPKCKNNSKGISKALDYILKTSGISINDINALWSNIKKFQQIRNCIVHSNGIVKSNYKGLDIYATSKKGLRYEEESNRIRIEKEYLIELGKTCFSFLENVMEKTWGNRPKEVSDK